MYLRISLINFNCISRHLRGVKIIIFRGSIPPYPLVDSSYLFVFQAPPLKNLLRGPWLSKLYHYGVRGIPLKWFENYLYNRSQFVKIDNIKSSYETIVCGIPQGSTLGPLLSLLYINDLPNCSNKLSLLMIQICFMQVIV